MIRPRHVFVAALAVLLAGSVALAIYAATPQSATRRTPDITLATMALPPALAVLVAQAMPYPSLGRRLAAAWVLFFGGLVFTFVVMLLVGCGVYGMCSK